MVKGLLIFTNLRVFFFDWEENIEKNYYFVGLNKINKNF
jgi:hypothetical protein